MVPAITQFSRLGNIVDLLVLTADDGFLKTLRESVGAARRIWHVPSADGVGDLLVAGEVGILVLDAESLHEAADVFVSRIKRQFPDLVVMVAGKRDAEISLASLISAGSVYRFIHQPVSPERVRRFAEAAVRKHAERPERGFARSRFTGKYATRRIWLAMGATIVLAAVVGALWGLHRDPPRMGPLQGAFKPRMIRHAGWPRAPRLRLRNSEQVLRIPE